MVLSVLVLLLALELFFRATSSRISQDVAKIEKLDEVANKLGAAQPSRILFVGNSILRDGNDTDQFTNLIEEEESSANLTAYAVHPDSSHAVIWDYMLSRYFIAPGSHPEDVVIVTGRIHLRDQHANPTDLGGYYVCTSDIKRYLKTDAESLDDVIFFFLGRFSETARMRKRVSPRIYDILLPYYQENWIHLNRPRKFTASAEKTDKKSASTSPTISTDHLESIIEMHRRNEIRLTVVKAPMPKPYELDPEILSLLDQSNVSVLDMSNLPSLTIDHFADEDHLNSSGKSIFTKALAAAMAKYWRG